MLRSVKQLIRSEIMAKDGAIGSVVDLYFDEERWAVRYLVIDTGKWLPGRRVLISPFSVASVEWNAHQLLLSITREQVKNSPGIETHKPVSRQLEMDLLDYYGYPHYWAGGLWGAHALPIMPSPQEVAAAKARQAEERKVAAEQGDTHLRSSTEVTGYRIGATDGDIGHVEDFLFDDATWALRYLVVDTKNWWPGKHVLVSPAWITDVSWPQHSVNVNVTRERLKAAPLYDRAEHLDRQWEATYFESLQKEGYWRADEEPHR